jgi:hypothetical protein
MRHPIGQTAGLSLVRSQYHVSLIAIQIQLANWHNVARRLS